MWWARTKSTLGCSPMSKKKIEEGKKTLAIRSRAIHEEPLIWTDVVQFLILKGLLGSGFNFKQINTIYLCNLQFNLKINSLKIKNLPFICAKNLESNQYKTKFDSISITFNHIYIYIYIICTSLYIYIHLCNINLLTRLVQIIKNKDYVLLLIYNKSNTITCLKCKTNVISNYTTV